ncbi:MAG: methyltransferase domain-containing protein [Acidobacteriia bacterium]|nr:methyltransferase domain-containing protein [Terriglobia bacterium]
MNSRRFKPTEAHRLEDPERLLWLPPSEVLSLLPLRSGMRVADIGAGTGYFTLPIAQEIGPSGKVWALDVEPEMLAKLKKKIESAGGFQNVELFEGEATNTRLPPGELDLLLMANLWHELDDPEGALREANRLLRIGGRLAILDWRPDVDRPPGPPLEHRIPPAEVKGFLESNKWSVERTSQVGRYSYFLLAVSPKQ